MRHDRLLAIAPHPDDESIGCGGTLTRAAALGHRCDVVFVTDGSASHPNSLRYPPERLRVIREHEAREALRTLGIATKPTFLRAPDGRLASLAGAERAKLVATLAATIAALRPGAVLVPWRRDPHPDHVATAALVDDALAACGATPDVYAYGVWLAERGATDDRPASGESDAVEIALVPDEVATKRRAILAYRSQATDLIDDDPTGFRISAELLGRWLAPFERFYVRARAT